MAAARLALALRCVAVRRRLVDVERRVVLPDVERRVVLRLEVERLVLLFWAISAGAPPLGRSLWFPAC